MTTIQRSYLGLILTMFFASPVVALTVVNLSEEQMAKNADMIIIGRILSAYAQRDPVDQDVYTYIKVLVNDHLKGTNRTHRITIKMPGGVIGGEISIIPGAADFYRNEEVLLFVEKRADGELTTLGLSLGKYGIYRDPESGRKIVLRQFNGTGRYFSSPRAEEIKDIALPEKVYLNEFRSRIQRMLEKGRPR